MFTSYSAGIDFRRQNLTTKCDPRAARVKRLKHEQFLGMSTRPYDLKG